ncbi:MAG: sugar ABC transporter ATP-binding protein [Opitutaceae bacterium]|jgi:ribose transport system ATP-binding protein
MASPSRQILLQMRGISKRFPGAVALDGVDLEVRRGEVHVLLGENGAGKSTLIKILAGALRRDAGTLEIDGRPCELATPRDARAAGVSVIYQEFNLVPGLTVAENIFLGREPRGFLPGVIDQARLVRRAEDLLRSLGVAIDPRAVVRRLGMAEQQMVEVAKALSVEARIVVMDEPTSALTDREIARLFQVIRALRERGTAIIYISHRLDELFQIGDRVTILRDGRLIGTRVIAESSRAELIRLMVGRELNEQFPPRTAAPGAEALRVEGLTRRGVLEDISFTLHRGEVLGLTGLMGAGRTELARALFGADPIDSGRIWVRGREVVIRSPRHAIRLGLGFLTEDRKRQGLVLGRSVMDNTCLASLSRFSRGGIMRAGRERAEASRLVSGLRVKTPGLGERVLNLSGGNQQKVVLAKWLCRSADILLFDEPTRGIDVGAKAEVYQLVRRLAAEGSAILVISSELPEILGLSDRILVLNRGRLAGEFGAAEATQEAILRCALGANAA